MGSSITYMVSLCRPRVPGPWVRGWEPKGRQGHRKAGPGCPEPAWSCSEVRTKLLHQALSESEDPGTRSISQGALSLLHQPRLRASQALRHVGHTGLCGSAGRIPAQVTGRHAALRLMLCFANHRCH